VTFGTTTTNSKRLNSPPRQLASEAAFDLKAGVESGSVGVTLGTFTSNSKRLNSTPRQFASDTAFDLKAVVESESEKGRLQSKKRRKMRTCSSSPTPSEMPSRKGPIKKTGSPTEMPSEQPTVSRFIALRNVIGSKYPDRPFDFGPTTNQYAALELLANSDPGLVPVPNDDMRSYLLLQRYALMVLYFATNGDTWEDTDDDVRWLAEQSGLTTCKWFGVTCSDGEIVDLDRTCRYSTVEPVIRHMITSLIAVLFSKSIRHRIFKKGPFGKPSYGNRISDDT
jgi:hypothetical protein